MLNVHGKTLCQPRQNHLDQQQTPNLTIRETNPDYDQNPPKAPLSRSDLVLDSGADITARDEEGGTPLHLAARRASAETVNALIDRGADPNVGSEGGWTPLQQAARWGSAETVNALIDRGVDPNVGSDWVWGLVALANFYDIAVNPLLYPAATINALADRGVDLTALTKGPLHLAAAHGNAETVNALIDRGADMTARDLHGKTPFDYIVFRV